MVEEKAGLPPHDVVPLVIYRVRMCAANMTEAALDVDYRLGLITLKTQCV